MLNERQTAIALAGLRFAQAHAPIGVYEEIVDLDKEMTPQERFDLSEEIASAIDEVCETINFGPAADTPRDAGDDGVVYRDTYFDEMDDSVKVEISIHGGYYGPFIEFAHPGGIPICRADVDFYGNKLRLTVNGLDPDAEAGWEFLYSEEASFVHAFTEDWTNYGKTIAQE
jgi:hypothetical protein